MSGHSYCSGVLRKGDRREPHHRIEAAFVGRKPIRLLPVYTRTDVLVEWDRNKARLSFRKRGVSFAAAVAALEDEAALTMRDLFLNEEERWVTIGTDALGRVVVVVTLGEARASA